MPHTRIALSLAALLLGATALSQPAQAGWFDFGSSKSDAKTADKADAKTAATADIAPAQDLDGAIRQAQLLRTSGKYAEAIKSLSQIMLVAADDPRVVTEYGKTLAAMGRSADAVNFLTRAQQLSPNDWSVYSALGVAYDQSGDQANARIAYEHALALKPDEPSVLNNYALSRMLAKDSDGAHRLIARAEAAGGASDPKIARNITRMKEMTPPVAVANAVPTPKPVAQMPPQAAPRTAVISHPMPQVATAAPQPQTRPFVSLSQAPVAQAAPRPLVAANAGVIQAQPQPMLQQAQPRGVVMQQVPVDPLAGPVLPKHIAAAIPAPPKAKQADARPAPQAAPAPVKTAAQSPAAQANNLEARAEAIAKQLVNKPAAQAQAVAAAEAPTAKPASKPAVLPAKPVVKVADAKPAAKPAEVKAIPVKTAAKDAVPALRVSASVY